MEESASFDWDAVPDMTVDGRSIVPYPEPDPEGVAFMWEKWKAERAERTALRGASPDEDAPPDVYRNYEPPVITMEAEEFDEPISALAGVLKIAVGAGWSIAELAHSTSEAAGKVIQTGARAGERHPDRSTETQWVKLEKPGVGRAVISYTIHNGKTDSTATYRSFNGLAGRSDAEMKELIKG